MKSNILALIFAALFCLLGAKCNPDPVAPTPVTVLGGSSFGGSSAVGGSSDVGGTVAGGTSSEISWLACDYSKKKPAATPRSLSGWKPTKGRALHKRPKASYAIDASSVFNQTNLEVPLDQLNLGSCTGNDEAHVLSTYPFTAQLTEWDAVAIYSKATEIDPFKGTYPPTDTGSNGESAARAAFLLGYTNIGSVPVYSVEGLQIALHKSSCAVGSEWFPSFNYPTACGEVKITGWPEGGHSYQVLGWNSELRIFIFRNSWGPTYGVCRSGNPRECGYFYMSAGTVQQMLDRGMEIDCPDL